MLRPVLLLDEPFAALDPGLRAAMVELLKDLHAETGSTILLVTHDPRDVVRLADHVLFIEDGQVLLNASKTEFLATTDLQAVRDFLGDTVFAGKSP